MCRYIFLYSNNHQSNIVSGKNAEKAYKQFVRDWLFKSQPEKERFGIPLPQYQLVKGFPGNGAWKTIQNLPDVFHYPDLRIAVDTKTLNKLQPSA